MAMHGHHHTACYSNWMQNVSLNGKWGFDEGQSLSGFDGQNLTAATLMRFLTKNDEGAGGVQGVLYSFLPHLLAALVLVVLVSRTLHWSLRCIKLPLIVCQLIAGTFLFSFVSKASSSDNGDIILQPANRRLDHIIGSIGITFSVFTAAVKLDPMTMIEVKKKPVMIGVSSMLVPFVVGITFCLVKYRELGILSGHQSQLVLFMLFPLCTTPPVAVYEILAELDLLNSELGRLAISSGMAQGVLGLSGMLIYILMKQGQKRIVDGFVAVILCCAFAVVIVLSVRYYSRWIVRNTPTTARVREVHIFVLTFAVFAMGLLSDLCGFYSYTDLPIILGLAIPNGPPLGTALIERVDLVVAELLVPIVFMHQGVYMGWSKDNLSVALWVGLLVLLTFIAKLLTNIATALYWKMSLKEGMLLGCIMNFRGYLDMLIFICLINQQLMDKETFSALVLSSTVITAVCAPLVSIFYKPMKVKHQIALRTIEGAESRSELSMMTCFFDAKPVQALLDFLEFSSVLETDNNSTCIYSLHLVELQGRATSDLIYHYDKKGQISTQLMDPVHNHFITFEQTRAKGTTGVSVIPITTVALLGSMHHDIFSLILKKNISLVILPYPKKNTIAALEATNSMQDIVPAVLEGASCSVGIMVYHGTTRIVRNNSSWVCRVGVLFWGGPDDREALAIASRMACHPGVELSVFHFHTKTDQKDNDDDDIYQKISNDQVFSKLLMLKQTNDRIQISSIRIENANHLILEVQRLYGDAFDLMIVGRRQKCLSMYGDGLSRWTESPELGVIGDLIASDTTCTSNVLIVQQHVVAI